MNFKVYIYHVIQPHVIQLENLIVLKLWKEVWLH